MTLLRLPSCSKDEARRIAANIAKLPVAARHEQIIYALALSIDDSLSSIQINTPHAKPL
jgi:hypothetical protein